MSAPPPDEPNFTGVPKEFPQAVTALSTLGTTAVTEVSNLARCMGRIVGTVPEDAVGFLIGDPLHAIRSLAAGWYDIKVSEILERRKAKTQPVSLSVAIPLIRGAYDESREGLREMWAELIANAMDPARSGRVRLSFIETLRQFDPMDALVLKARVEAPGGQMEPHHAGFLSGRLRRPLDEVLLSVETLKTLRCIYYREQPENFVATRYGHGLYSACSQ